MSKKTESKMLKNTAKNKTQHINSKSILKDKKYYQNFIKKSIEFLQQEAAKRGVQNFVVGLSGGVDSAVVAALCKMAIQNLNQRNKNYLTTSATQKHTLNEIFALAMPSSSSSKDSLIHAKKLAHTFNLPLKILPLEHYQKEFINSHKIATNKLPLPLEMGNFCARLRMALLYDYSAHKKAIVVGTSNKSELMLGYGTIFGDLACGINPIGSLYKSEIFALAKMLKIPQVIISKPPSADLYAGQSDEGELGFSYAEIDIVLEAICKKYGDFRKVKNFQKINIKKLSDSNGKALPKAIATMAKKRITQNLFKRELPLIFVP